MSGISCSHPDCPNKRTLTAPEVDTLGGIPVHVPKGIHGPRATAPDDWILPMAFRKTSPWGYTHGEFIASSKYQKPHPGFDFNDGPTAFADMGQPLYAVRPGVVVYAKRTDGWGTLVVLKLDELVDGREVFVRYGHPRDIYVLWGEHVEAGQIIGTCGDGYLPNRFSPHLHYDIGYVDSLYLYSKDRGLGKPDYQWYQQTKANFNEIYLDPRTFHPEVREWFLGQLN